MRLTRGLFLGLCCLLAITVRATAEEPAPDAAAKAAATREGEELFEQHIRPLFVHHCGKCHGPDKQEAGLRLDNRAAVEQGGDSGPIISPGNPDASRLIQLVRYAEDVQMPPDGKLPEEAIAFLTDWVKRGAPWPAEKAEDRGTMPETTSSRDLQRIAHWAFQRIQPQPVPETQNKSWPQSPIDAFILARLEAKGLMPNELADRRTLIRRATYDLTGLPPTFDEINAFVNDSASDAFIRLVDRLLGSPQYGERWGRHWLDVARYADTKGYVGVDKGDLERREYPFAFSYRDWVIKAVNDDLPYDQFLTQQIAADKLPLGDDKTALAALGFFRVGRVFLNNRNDQIDDRIDVLMRGTQGLTVACARCHDHKFDPIPTADYYSLFGVFASTDEPDNAEQKLMLLADKEHPHNAKIMKRGNPATPGDEVPRQFLSVVSGPDRKPFTAGSGRLELAAAVVSRDNPLTARVFVNRVWANHFGMGFVRTTSDFGVRTERPELAELLDYLADRFMTEGWSLKKLHRWIMLSSVYQQTRKYREDCAKADPENRLFWRAGLRRLDFEQLRDSMLSASGDLDLAMGGPAVELTQEPFPHRRTVYGRVDRQNLPGMFRTFDFANPDAHSAGRFQTTVPQQGLFVFNSAFVIERAKTLAARSLDTNNTDPAARIQRLYQFALARTANDSEMSLARSFVESKGTLAADSPDVLVSWQSLAQALLMSNEFVFVD